MSSNACSSHLDKFLKSLEAKKMGENDELSKSASKIRCHLKQPQVQELATLVKKQKWEEAARAMQLHFPTTNAANHRVLVEQVLVCLGKRPFRAFEWVLKMQPEFQPGAWDAVYERCKVTDNTQDMDMLLLLKHIRESPVGQLVDSRTQIQGRCGGILSKSYEFSSILNYIICNEAAFGNSLFFALFYYKK
jgi:hypothetical protein